MLVNVPLKFRQRVYKRLLGGSPYIKMVNCKAAVQEAQPNQLYTGLPGVNIKLLFTQQPFQSQFRYTRLPCVHIKSLFTRPHFRLKSAIYIAHGCIQKIIIYMAAVQESNRLYTLLPGVYKNRYLYGSHSRSNSR